MPGTDLQTLQEARSWPRSERVELIFNFEPTEYQTKLLDHQEQEDKAQAAPKAGRQVGKTMTAGVIGADHALVAPEAPTDVLFAAPAQATADEMFRECKQHFKRGPLSLEQYGVVTENKREWEFSTGVRILARTLGNVEQEDNPGNRGMNPTCVIVDEAAYEKDAVYTQEIEEFFITHPEYEFYLFSTPAGKSGYFYDAVEGQNSERWFSPHWPTKISPYAQQDYIERKERELDSQTFAQEFLGEFAESEDAYLPYEIVKPCIDSDSHRQQAIPRYLGVDPSERGDDRLVITDMDEKGDVHNIWSKDKVSGPEFIGLLSDLQTGEIAPEPDWGTKQLPVHGYEWIVVESNMAGLATDIAQAGLGDVILPVKSTKKSKGPMYKRLKRDLESEELTLPNYRRLISETTALKYSYTPNQHLKLEHPPGGHDDYPDSLMLANAGRVGLAKQFETENPEAQSQKASATFSW